MAAAGVSRAGTTQEQERLLGALSPTTQSQLGRTEGFSTGLSNTHSTHENPKLVSELHVLRQRKDELETRMNNLQLLQSNFRFAIGVLISGNCKQELAGTGEVTQAVAVSHSATATRTSATSGTCLQPSDPNTEINSLANIRSGTPSGGTRFGHNSRASANPPENPPRRSSSLSHASGDRLYNTGRVDSALYKRNRTELMLQLETLVRLLSVGGTGTGGGVSIPPQTRQPLPALQPSDPNTEINSLANIRSGTPSGGTRFGHNSRASANPPENPPRRSSSLSHASGDRLYNTGRVDSALYKDSRCMDRRYPRKISESNWTTEKSLENTSLIAADLLRKNLLSPTNDLLIDSNLNRTAPRYGF
ncbi:hypothetical protein AHF37_09331 [Paragonimus kellicotti]|nr:hypothetical protein AHF37_09331 [Paragonimus kellicotti]